MSLNLSLLQNEDHNVLEFTALAKQTVRFAMLASCNLKAFSGPNLPFFSKLGVLEQRNAIERLKVYNEICSDVLADGKSLKDSTALTWYALKKFNFIFSSDLFQYIHDDNVIEVYDRDNVQIFRNFHFFDVSSYTLEDLLCRPWTDLFMRANQDHTQAIINTCQKFYTKEVTTVTPLANVGTHRIIESDSPFSFQVDAVVDYLAPLYDKSRYPCGFIAIESANLASQRPEGEVAERLLQKYYSRMELISSDLI
ncbi:MAG: hypothetical protein ACKOX6_04930 [Bdellovibrio sp.]